MAPLDYKQVRDDNNNNNNNLTVDSIVKDNNENEIVAIVDGYPYYPFVYANPNNISSIQTIAMKIMFHNKNNKNDSTLIFDSDTTTCNNNNSIVEKISGGITNILYKVTFSDCTLTTTTTTINNNECLVRIFGAEGMINRDNENATYVALASCGIAPPYYGRFGNGRIEGWCRTGRPLQTIELSNPIIASSIAQEMANLHTNFIIPTGLQKLHDLSKPSSLWEQIYDWFNQAQTVILNDPTVSDEVNEHNNTILQSLHVPDLYNELQWLQNDVIPQNAPLVFCHNDLLAANILYSDTIDVVDSVDNNTTTTSSSNNNTTTTASSSSSNNNTRKKMIQLIDFEYGGINYAGFDIANHFNEYAGGPPTHPTPDYTLLPNTEQQYNFCSTYLQRAQYNIQQQQLKTTNTDLSSLNPYYEQIVTMTVEDLYNQVAGFLLVNHLYWGLWAINQANTEGCTVFDYLVYGQNRIKEYWIRKNVMLLSRSNN